MASRAITSSEKASRLNHIDELKLIILQHIGMAM